MRHIRESVFVLILGSAARRSCELLSDFLPLLKGLRGEGEVSRDPWRDGGKGAHSNTMACMQHSVGGMFYLKTRGAQQSVAFDNWKHPERKEQEMFRWLWTWRCIVGLNLTDMLRIWSVQVGGREVLLLHLTWLSGGDVNFKTEAFTYISFQKGVRLRLNGTETRGTSQRPVIWFD